MKFRSYKILFSLICAAVLLGTLALILNRHGVAAKPKLVRELTRSELELRDEVLYPRGSAKPFEGRIVEKYSSGARKMVIEVRNGRLDGRSIGYYLGGQMEVDEQFVEGISHGPRTRWYANGKRRSNSMIEHGKVTGPYTEWYENGRKAVEMTLREGKPDGQVNAWFASGAPKSRLRYENGKQIEKQFWKDPAEAAGTVAAASGTN